MSSIALALAELGVVFQDCENAIQQTELAAAAFAMCLPPNAFVGKTLAAVTVV